VLIDCDAADRRRKSAYTGFQLNAAAAAVGAPGARDFTASAPSHDLRTRKPGEKRPRGRPCWSLVPPASSAAVWSRA
jgi:hypothetical protein